LLSLGVVPLATVEASGWTAWAADLVRARRATWAGSLLIAAERVATVRLAMPRELGGVDFAPPVQEALFGRRGRGPGAAPLGAIVGGWLECVGPTTVAELAVRSGLPPSRVAVGLGRLERSGAALRGRYRAGAQDEEWCERGLLARIHRLTLGRLRKAVEPVSAADLMRFFFRWQHVQPGTRLHGRQGLLAVLGQLEGGELPARAWESPGVPARVSGYQPDDLEHLCLAGIVAWGRLRAPAPSDDAPAPAPARPPPLAL